MDSAEAKRRFVRDGIGFLHEIVQGLRVLIRDGSSHGIVNELFRLTHSLKSEAAFVGARVLMGDAESLEALLEDLRSGTGLPDRSFVQNAQAIVRRLNGHLARLSASDGLPQGEATFGESGGSDAPRLNGNGAKRALRQVENGPGSAGRPTKRRDRRLTPLEVDMLREAQRRGERCFGVSVRLAADERMKKTRAYLLVNNLEVTAHVVRVWPSPDEPDEDLYERLDFLLTISGSEAGLYQAVNVDQVVSVKVRELDYDLVSAGRWRDAGAETSRTFTAPAQTFAVEETWLRELQDILSAVRSDADAIVDAAAHFGSGGELQEKAGRISGVAAEAVERIDHLTTARVGEEFIRLRQLALDVAADLGKNVHVKVDAGDVAGDRRTIEAVSDLLMHLVRNAVDHGIETPADRVRAGKPEVGTIELAVTRGSAETAFVVADDGKGVDLSWARRRAHELGLNVDENSSLTEILSTPGFTSGTGVQGHSGRGVGLDVVRERVALLGGSVDVESTKGQGTTVHVFVPGP